VERWFRALALLFGMEARRDGDLGLKWLRLEAPRVARLDDSAGGQRAVRVGAQRLRRAGRELSGARRPDDCEPLLRG